MMLGMEVYKVANMVKENTFKEQSLRLLTFETFDQSDEKHDMTNKITTKKTRTKTTANTFREHPQRVGIFE